MLYITGDSRDLTTRPPIGGATNDMRVMIQIGMGKGYVVQCMCFLSNIVFSWMASGLVLFVSILSSSTSVSYLIPPQLSMNYIPIIFLFYMYIHRALVLVIYLLLVYLISP